MSHTHTQKKKSPKSLREASFWRQAVDSCGVALVLDNGVHKTRIRSYLHSPMPGICSPYKEIAQGQTLSLELVIRFQNVIPALSTQCDLGKVLFNFSEFHMIYLKVREEHHKELCLYKVVVKANNTAQSRGSASHVYLINNKQRSFAWSDFHLFSDFQSIL